MHSGDIVLIGAGGHTRACIDVIEEQGKFRIIGLLGTAAEVDMLCLGYPVIGTDADIPRLSRECEYALVTIGQIESPHLRKNLYQLATGAGFQLPVVAAPSAHVSRHATIEPGTIVMHGATVNAGAVVGQNCIINNHSLVEHDVTIGDHCHLSTRSVLNGNVTMGSGSFVGSGTVVKEGVTLGTNTLVGMGLAVRHDLTEGARFTGGALDD